MPGVMIVEAMAQTAGALVMYSMNARADDKLVYFMSIDKARFRNPVVPGDMLHIPVKLQRARKPVWRFAGEAYVNGKLCAEAQGPAIQTRPVASTLCPHLPPCWPEPAGNDGGVGEVGILIPRH